MVLCVTCLFLGVGIRGFWAGSRSTLWMATNPAVTYVIYERLQRRFSDWNRKRANQTEKAGGRAADEGAEAGSGAGAGAGAALPGHGTPFEQQQVERRCTSGQPFVFIIFSKPGRDSTAVTMQRLAQQLSGRLVAQFPGDKLQVVLIDESVGPDDVADALAEADGCYSGSLTLAQLAGARRLRWLQCPGPAPSATFLRETDRRNITVALSTSGSSQEDAAAENVGLAMAGHRLRNVVERQPDADGAGDDDEEEDVGDDDVDVGPDGADAVQESQATVAQNLLAGFIAKAIATVYTFPVSTTALCPLII